MEKWCTSAHVAARPLPPARLRATRPSPQHNMQSASQCGSVTELDSTPEPPPGADGHWRRSKQVRRQTQANARLEPPLMVITSPITAPLPTEWAQHPGARLAPPGASARMHSAWPPAALCPGLGQQRANRGRLGPAFAEQTALKTRTLMASSISQLLATYIQTHSASHSNPCYRTFETGGCRAPGAGAAPARRPPRARLGRAALSPPVVDGRGGHGGAVGRAMDLAAAKGEWDGAHA